MERDRDDRQNGRHTDGGQRRPDTKAERPDGDLERVREARADASREDPDVFLDIPTLKVGEVDLEVDDLRARVSLRAEVLDLLKLNVGVDVVLGRVKLDITDVEAQALLKVRLDNVAEIVGDVLRTIERNPQIVEQVARPLENTAQSLGSGAGEAVGELARGTGEAAKNVTDTAQDTVKDVTGTVQDTAEEAGETVHDTAEEAGETAHDTAKDVTGTARSSTDEAAGGAESLTDDTVEAAAATHHDDAPASSRSHPRTRRTPSPRRTAASRRHTAPRRTRAGKNGD